MSQKLVVLGGSLAPATIAHLAILNLACETIQANGILVPSSDPYVLRKLKRVLPEPQAQFFANYEQFRKPVLESFVNQYPNISISEIELSSYKYGGHTLETLRALQKAHPHEEIYFLMGSDVLSKFRKWSTCETLLQEFHILVTTREKDNSKQLVKTLFSKYQNRFQFLNTETLHMEQISSTMIRTFAKNHDYESIQQYSNPVAAKLIKERKFSL